MAVVSLFFVGRTDSLDFPCLPSKGSWKVKSKKNRFIILLFGRVVRNSLDAIVWHVRDTAETPGGYYDEPDGPDDKGYLQSYRSFQA